MLDRHSTTEQHPQVFINSVETLHILTYPNLHFITWKLIQVEFTYQKAWNQTLISYSVRMECEQTTACTARATEQGQ